MCMGCMGNADFLLTGGIVGAASLRVAARSALPGIIRRPRKVSDGEVSEFLASLQPTIEPAGPPTDAGADGSAERSASLPVHESASGRTALVP